MVKNPPTRAGDAGDMSLIPGLGRSPGEENGNPLWYSCLGNPRDGGAWWVAQSGTRLKRLSSSSSRILMGVWPSLVAQSVKIGLQCGRPGFNPWVGNIPCKSAWQPTPVVLLKNPYGQRTLDGYSP